MMETPGPYSVRGDEFSGWDPAGHEFQLSSLPPVVRRSADRRVHKGEQLAIDGMK